MEWKKITQADGKLAVYYSSSNENYLIQLIEMKLAMHQTSFSLMSLNSARNTELNIVVDQNKKKRDFFTIYDTSQ